MYAFSTGHLILTLYLGGLIVSSDFRDNYIRLRYNVNQSLSRANLVATGREGPHKRRARGAGDGGNKSRKRMISGSNSSRMCIWGHHEHEISFQQLVHKPSISARDPLSVEFKSIVRLLFQRWCGTQVVGTIMMIHPILKYMPHTIDEGLVLCLSTTLHYSQIAQTELLFGKHVASRFIHWWKKQFALFAVES